MRKKLEALSLPPPGGVYATGVWLPQSGTPHLPPPVIGQSATNPMNPLVYHHTRPNSVPTQHTVAPPIPHPHPPLVTTGAIGHTVPGGITGQTSTTRHVTPLNTEGYTTVIGAVRGDHVQPLATQQSLPSTSTGRHGDRLFFPTFDLPTAQPAASTSELVSRDGVAPGCLQLPSPSNLHPPASLDTVLSWSQNVGHQMTSTPALLADGSSTTGVVYAQVSPFSHQLEQLDHSHTSSLLPSLDSSRHVHFAPKPQVKEMTPAHTPVHRGQSNYGLYSHAPWSSDALTYTRALTDIGAPGSFGCGLTSPEAPSPPPLSIALQVPSPQAPPTTSESGLNLASLTTVGAPVSATSRPSVAEVSREKEGLSLAWPVKDSSLHILSGADLSVESSLPEEDNQTSLKTVQPSVSLGADQSPPPSPPETNHPSSPPFLDVRSSVERMSTLAKSVLQDISQQKEQLRTQLQQEPPPPAAWPDQLESASSKDPGMAVATSTTFSDPTSLSTFPPPNVPLKVTASSLMAPAPSPLGVSSLPALHRPILPSKTAVVQRNSTRPAVVQGGWASQPMPTQGGGASQPMLVLGGVASQSLPTQGGEASQPLLVRGGGASQPMLVWGGGASQPLLTQGSEGSIAPTAGLLPHTQVQQPPALASQWTLFQWGSKVSTNWSNTWKHARTHTHLQKNMYVSM